MQDKIDAFLEDFRKWSQTIGIPTIDSVNEEEILNISNSTYSDLSRMSLEEPSNSYFNIMKFMNNLSSSINELQTVFDYCDSSINYIICDKILRMDGYAKTEIKVMHCIKSDDFCKSLLKIQNDAKSKLNYLKDRMAFFTKMSDMIDSITKRKIYDRSN